MGEVTYIGYVGFTRDLIMHPLNILSPAGLLVRNLNTYKRITETIQRTERIKIATPMFNCFSARLAIVRPSTTLTSGIHQSEHLSQAQVSPHALEPGLCVEIPSMATLTDGIP